MCTLVVLRRPGHPWPLLLGANRDEMEDRPWRPPARHWPDRPEVTAGMDLLAGGSWLGINDHGMVAAVTNRHGSLGPAPGRRSRGELVLEALDHAGADEAAHALKQLDPAAYRPFNLLIADPVACYWLRNRDRRIQLVTVGEGLHMLTAGDLDDPDDPRIGRYLPRFRSAKPPDPEAGDWRAWEALFGAREYLNDDQGPDRKSPGDPAGDAAATGAMCWRLDNGFGTRSGSLIALPRHPGPDAPPVWRFAAGPPDRTGYRPVTLSAG
ncbi:MAG TPA: hypothetical protein ENI96_14920 [Sedimenticola thiotaurini]|uniref:NRDE family protein n=1 Tax=Sedimenticola thiotaurini TaxID=1543721 RepID=A0A831W6X7_9GAMM|nr:hypothetical protein [Sedimenticola thiotaurini]